MQSIANRKILRRALSGLALLASVSLVGCYGRFTLTRSLYHWNGDVTSDRYLRSIIFWPLSIVYAGAAIVDALIINVLEFWSGDKVVDEAMLPDGGQVKMVSAGNGAPLMITVTRAGQPTLERQLVVLQPGKFEVRDATGHKLGTLERDGKQFTVYNAQDQRVGQSSQTGGVLAL